MVMTTTLERCQTRCFGALDYDENSVLIFPDGLPAFEQETRFLLVEQASNKPLVFLQSLRTPELCFPTLPVQAVTADYRLKLTPEELQTLGLEAGGQPEIGRDVLCLAIISLEENTAPTANLLAPVVLNLRNMRCLQSIQGDYGYALRHPLLPREATCS